MIDKVQLCVTLIILARNARERGDEKACVVYGDTMKFFIRKHGITIRDCDEAMRLVQYAARVKSSVKMEAVEQVA